MSLLYGYFGGLETTSKYILQSGSNFFRTSPQIEIRLIYQPKPLTCYVLILILPQKGYYISLHLERFFYKILPINNKTVIENNYMTERHKPNEVAPIYQVRDALKRAKAGQNCGLTQENLLGMLHLSGDQPDQRTLMDRFVGTSPFDVLNPLRQMAVSRTAFGVINLLRRYTDGFTTPQENELAGMLATAAIKQFNREGDICPLGTYLLTNAPDNLVPEEVKQRAAILDSLREH